MASVYTRHLISATELFVSKPPPDKFWKEKAACEPHQALFLADFDHKQIAASRRNEQKTQAICIKCPVRAHCLWAALEANEKDLMWGGLNPDQRQWIRRRLNLKDEEVA